ncbi:hypothetical protein [Cellulosimicrobium composti]|uniref:hypothetical protein n=1 Tax=Cellulosimicrobium composti TaxID=2672572 RepID=UPI00379BFE19
MGKTLRGAAALTATAALTILGASTANAYDPAVQDRLVDDYLVVEPGELAEIDPCANDTTGDTYLLVSDAEGIEGGVNADAFVAAGCTVKYMSPEDFQGEVEITLFWEQYDADGNLIDDGYTSKLYITVAETVDGPVIAPAFALGGLALAGAGVGARTLTKRRRTH